MIGLPFGHIKDYATLPLGIRASVDTRTGELSIDESAVRG
jgi:muramoyltetrapeptide carboxypeptidase LdcA involved in peptidoglycan recycling